MKALRPADEPTAFQRHDSPLPLPLPLLANSASSPNRECCRGILPLLALLVAWMGLCVAPARADELADALVEHAKEDWLACLPLARAAVKARPWNERAWHALIQSQVHTGDALGATETFEEAFRRFPSSLRLRLAGRDAMRMSGQSQVGEALTKSIDELVKQAPWRYTDADNRVMLGNFYLSNGADARQVLEVFFDQAKRSAPSSAEPHIAAGQLAFAKGDNKLAADSFQQALKRDEANPRALLGMALAFLESDGEKGLEYLEQTLKACPRHIPSLLALAERELDGELYEDAIATLDRVFEVNSDQPEAWALRSVVATLQGDDEDAAFYRRLALAWWPNNPAVDFLIGRKLARHYRFAEAAERQRNVLKIDPTHAPAMLQLSQNLLRLGQEEEGWKLAEQALDQDGYSVLAHNLVQLQTELAKFKTLTSDAFILRMDAREAAVYGDQVMALLEQARATLCEKYRHELRTPVIVEIFPRQSDFAIRTFGMPGGDGFLGVCFGNVITANSPASQGDRPANWASVLWHEFCHVVTLQKTNNRMPRWLSEGLSVYEERERRANWGQGMTPAYRRMILEGELTPVSQLSNAFLKPPSAMHLQFAYFESSMVVRYLIQQYGREPMLRVLDELGQGMPINDALARTAGSIEALDHGFAAYAKEQAEQFAAELDWTPMPKQLAADRAARAAWIDQHPNSLPAIQQQAKQLAAAKNWPKAESVLQKLIQQLPEEGGAGSPRDALALVYRKTSDAQAEADALRGLTQVDADYQRAYLRLMELAVQRKDWKEARWAGERLCEINPMQSALQEQLASLAVREEDHQAAVGLLSAVLALDPIDPAGAHFQLAKSLDALGDRQQAKRHVLMALEEAPRFREAQQLLLAIVAASDPSAEPRGEKGAPLLPPLEVGPLLPPLEQAALESSLGRKVTSTPAVERSVFARAK